MALYGAKAGRQMGWPDFDASRGRWPKRVWHHRDARLNDADGLGTRRTSGCGGKWILPEGSGNLMLSAHHDEDMEVYINGVEAASASGYTTDYVQIPLNAPGRAALKPGKNVMAVHCHQTTGGQYIDVGLINPPN